MSTMKLIKRHKTIAHKINEHGKKPAYPLETFEEYKNRYFMERHHAHEHAFLPLEQQHWTIQVEKRARKEYSNKYKKNYPVFPNDTQQKQYSEIFNRILNEYYQQYVKDYNNSNISKQSKSDKAAEFSLLGTPLTAIPHPITRGLGFIFGLPDQIYDWASAIDEPKPSNSAHVATDYLPYVSKLIPGKLDDIVGYGLNTLGNVDDAYSSQGKNMFQFLDKRNDTLINRE